MLAVRLALWLSLLSPALVQAQHLAYDECDGRRSAGFRAGPGTGWDQVAGEHDGMLLATQGNHWRELITPVRGGIVWYAVTLRMQAPIAGYASVVPAATPGQQVSELGFDSKLGSDQGLWTSGKGVVTSGIPATTLQTFLQRYDLDRRIWSAWAAAGDGLGLLSADGSIRAAAMVIDSPLNTGTIGALYLTKGSEEVLEIHRLALARTAAQALTPVTPGAVPAVESRPATAASAPSISTLGIAAFAQRAALPAGGCVAFFGDSLTWQGGHVELLRKALASARPDLGVRLLQRGINGGKSTDLVSGVKDLYGSTQAAFAQVLAADRPAAAVIQIGINDVWHGARGNSPAVFATAVRALLNSAADLEVPVLLCTPTLIGERRLGTNPHDAGLDAIAEVVRRLAAEPRPRAARVQLCDLRRDFGAMLRARNPADAERGILTHDGVHLDDDGNALLADLLARGLTALLGEVRPPPVPFALVPWPRSLTAHAGSIVLPANVTVQAPAALAAHAKVLALELTTLTGHQANPADGKAAAIELQLASDLPDEQYLLAIGTDRVVVRGRDCEAVARGTASLLQLLTRSGDSWTLPRITLKDGPTCGYRGLLIDVARRPHPVATLEQIVELCRFYKIRQLQLHLTDDQAFTFPSKAFPKLATQGHSYTLEELRQLQDFAVARGVTIVPELDVPGHCGAMIKAMPELFQASPKHHATIAFAKPEVLAAIDTLIGEMLEVFPTTPYFHVGGDEADLAHVHESAIFTAAFAREGVADAQQLYRRFLCQLRERVHARGKRMLVWEGFGPEGGVAIPTDVTVMAFEMLYHTPDKLVAAGYPVINTSWQPLYVVNDRAWSEREIHGWHRGRFRHFVAGYPAFGGMEIAREKVLGAQMCAWEQPAARELPSLRRRLPAMAERIWNEDAGRDIEDFLARLAVTDARLDHLLGKPR